MDNKNTVTELLEEAAACEALGANTAAESAAYQKTIADDPTGAAAKLDRNLRETTARLAAASPHLTPSADLRGRILEATAPKTFKMEDYRKATREDPRFYKWGFYAAAAFLIMASLYNMSVRRDLDNSNARFAALQNEAKQVATVNNEMKATLGTMVASSSVHVSYNENGTPFTRVIVNPAARKAVVIMPEEMAPAGFHPQISAIYEDQAIKFDTALIAAPAVQLGMKVPSQRPNFAQKPAVEKLIPDNANKIDIAGEGIFPLK